MSNVLLGPQLRKTTASRMLQIKHIDEILRCFSLASLHFGKFQGATQICPSPPTIDDSLYAQAGIHIFATRFSKRRGRIGEYASGGNLAQQRHRGWVSNKIAPAEIGDDWHFRSLRLQIANITA